MNRTIFSELTRPILTAHPNTQSIYLYGTWGTEHQRQDSDLDIAVLLPREEAKLVDHRQRHQLATEVAQRQRREFYPAPQGRPHRCRIGKKLIGMVGFRNIVTHQYRDIDYQLVEDIVKKHVDDLVKFAVPLVALPK